MEIYVAIIKIVGQLIIITYEHWLKKKK